MLNGIRITLSYKFADKDNWIDVSIAPEKYFDIDLLDEGEQLEIDSVPLYLGIKCDLKNFLAVDVAENKIVYAKLLISDDNSEAEGKTTATFWDYGNNLIIQYTNTNSVGEITWNQTITQLRSITEPNIIETISMFNGEDINVIGSHSYMFEDSEETIKCDFYDKTKARLDFERRKNKD